MEGQEQGKQEQAKDEFNADQAREYLSKFGHNTESFDEDSLKNTYASVNEHVSKTIEDRVNEALSKVQWGEKWRESLAGEDKDAMKTLSRFTDPTQLWKRTQELTKKLSSGELKAIVPFPKDGTPEEQTTWRKENNIPEKSTDYDISLPDGLVIGDADKPFLDSFLETAHAANLPNDVVKSQLNWYFGTYIPQMEQATAELDMEYRQEAQDKLRELWPGAEYKRNLNAVSTLLTMSPEGLRERLWGGRLADGKAIGDDPETLQWLAKLSLELNPASTLTGAGGENSMKGINEKLADYEKMMRDNRPAWNKNAEAQADYQRLLEAKNKMTQRAA